MIINVNKATWLGRSRVEVTFESEGRTDHSTMTYDDLHCIIEKLPHIITDVFWHDLKTRAPSWFIEQKRQCVFNSSAHARKLFGFDDNDIASIAAVFTNNLTKPVNIVAWMCEDATVEMLKKLGLAEKVADNCDLDFAPPRFLDMCRELNEHG